MIQVAPRVIALVLLFSCASGCAFLKKSLVEPFQILDPRKYSCDDLINVITIALGEHYSVREISPEIKEKVVKNFLFQIDPYKDILLKDDPDTIRASLNSFDWKAGNCGVIESVHDLLERRRGEAKQIIETAAASVGKVSYSPHTSLALMTRERYPTAEEREWFLEKKVQVLLSVYHHLKLDSEHARKYVTEYIQRNQDEISELGPEGLLGTYAHAFLLTLDPYSGIFQTRNKWSYVGGKPGGIGIEVTSVKNELVIKGLVPGGPADKSGKLRPGDKIIGYADGDGVPKFIFGMPLTMFVDLVVGQIGSDITLLIAREETDLFEITLKRKEISFAQLAPPVQLIRKVRDNREIDVAILRVPQLVGGTDFNTHTMVGRTITDVVAKGADVIVLDLRGNPGGRLEEALSTAGIFVTDKAVVALKSAKGEIEIKNSNAVKEQYHGPLMVWVDQDTAAGAEYIAAALQLYRRAIVVGTTKTFAAGTIQTGFEIARGRAMKVTTARGFFPNGKSVEPGGLSPDIKLASKAPIVCADRIQKLDSEQIKDFQTPTEHIVRDEMLKGLRANAKARAKASKQLSAVDEVSDIAADLVLVWPR